MRSANNIVSMHAVEWKFVSSCSHKNNLQKKKKKKNTFIH